VTDPSVRPPSEAELRTDSQIAWVTPAYDLRMIKPAFVRDGTRDKKEWFFGAPLFGRHADHRPYYRS
jgi:hypothetical protein